MVFLGTVVQVVSDLPMGSDVGIIPTNREIIGSVVDILGSYVESQKSYLLKQRQR